MIMIMKWGLAIGECDVAQDQPSRLSQLMDFLTVQDGAFRRSDQIRWAALYLLGLLEAEGRRNIEAVARAVIAGGHSSNESISQGLGHFLSQSPWDENRFWEQSASRVAGCPGVFVLDEVTFIKQGRHSVGVHRQHSRTLGRKANCQLAVALYHVNDEAELLALRLYLPRAWLRDEQRIEIAGVPQANRHPVDRATIGLSLLKTAREVGVGLTQVAASPQWMWSDEALQELIAAGYQPIELSINNLQALERTRKRLEELGLGHFEGRTWRGFHHHTCLVAIAEHFERVRENNRNG